MENTPNQRIKFRHMQCFLAVFQLGTVQRAADSLSLTQPAVSKTLAELEEIVGARLFERGRHGAAPTRHGQLFAPHARACIEALQLGVDELRHDTRTAAMIVTGVLPTVAATLAAPALAALRLQWPTTSVQVVTGSNQRLLEGLQSGEFDFAIGRQSDSELMDRLSFEHLSREPIAIVLHPAHPLREAPTLSAARLAGFPVVVPPTGTLIRRSTDNVLSAFGTYRPSAMIETLSVALGRELALKHQAVWFVPAGAVESDLDAGLLARLPLPLPGTDEPIGLLRRIGTALSPAAEALIAAVHRVSLERSPG